jgi:hypothetical protein
MRLSSPAIPLAILLVCSLHSADSGSVMPYTPPFGDLPAPVKSPRSNAWLEDEQGRVLQVDPSAPSASGQEEPSTTSQRTAPMRQTVRLLPPPAPYELQPVLVAACSLAAAVATAVLTVVWWRRKHPRPVRQHHDTTFILRLGTKTVRNS